MVRKLSLLVISFILTFSVSVVSGKNGELKPKAYMETMLSPVSTIEGVSTIYSVVVYANVSNILRIEILEDPDFGPLKAKPLNLGRGNDNYLGERKEKGETWYGFVVDSFVITPTKSGTYTIHGGTYNICLGTEGYVDDWFWGRQRTTVPNWVEEKAPDTKLTVKKRPANLNEDVPVSYGRFEAEWSVPPGDILENSRAIAIFQVKGEGTLDENALPDFKTIFGDDMEVVYVRPKVNTWVQGGGLKSEMTVTVEFIPKKTGKQSVPAVDFKFIDPKTGKQQKSMAPETDIEVKTDFHPASSKVKVYDI